MDFAVIGNALVGISSELSKFENLPRIADPAIINAIHELRDTIVTGFADMNNKFDAHFEATEKRMRARLC
jgi:hypothetical protein